jgi:hypothetical protein
MPKSVWQKFGAGSRNQGGTASVNLVPSAWKGRGFLLYRKIASYKAKNLRGMRTSRLGKLSADADALRRESPASRTLFYRKIVSYKAKNLRGMRTSRLRKLSADADALRRESPASRTLIYRNLLPIKQKTSGGCALRA